MDKVKDIWNNLFIWRLTKNGKIVAAVLAVIVLMILWGLLQMLGAITAIGPIAKMIGGIVDKAITDKDLKEKLKHELNAQLINGDHEELIAKSKIVQAEASSKHWLTATWRPALMWICIIVIANNYIISPILNATFGTSLELTIPDPMWNLLTIGVSGYIVGRSGEKIAQNWQSKG